MVLSALLHPNLTSDLATQTSKTRMRRKKKMKISSGAAAKTTKVPDHFYPTLTTGLYILDISILGFDWKSFKL
jgi:hypothetical protein